MTRRYNTLGRRICAVLQEGGPRPRTVLVGLAGGDKRLAPVLARLIKSGAVIVTGRKRGTKYACGKAAS